MFAFAVVGFYGSQQWPHMMAMSPSDFWPFYRQCVRIRKAETTPSRKR